jgi:hypothetical protein
MFSMADKSKITGASIRSPINVLRKLVLRKLFVWLFRVDVASPLGFSIADNQGPNGSAVTRLKLKLVNECTRMTLVVALKVLVK